MWFSSEPLLHRPSQRHLRSHAAECLYMDSLPGNSIWANAWKPTPGAGLARCGVHAVIPGEWPHPISPSIFYIIPSL